MVVDAALIQKLREITSAGVMECKRTLEETNGDFAKAQAILMERAAQKAEKKAEREMKHGLVDAYIHGDGRIGVLVEVHCETDFLAKSPAFRELVRNLALQIAAEAPQYIQPADVPAAVTKQVAAEAEEAARAQGKPDRVVEQIKAGKVQKFLSEVCLMEQRYIRNPDITVGDLVRSFIGQSGENVRVNYFARRQIGES